MFGSSNNNVQKNEISRVDTIIGENAVIEGTVRTKDTTRIDGKLVGEGFFEGHLIIGENGKVEGNITANSMLIAGSVQGNIHVRNKLEIAETGKIKGDITTKLLLIAEGAVFEGKSAMISDKSTSAASINLGAIEDRNEKNAAEKKFK